VSGIDVVLRLPAGADDMLLLEAGALDMDVALALLGRVGRDADGAPLDLATLPISDVDVLLLRLRQRIVGDVVTAQELCPGPACQARVDITFSIGAYLEHHLPAAPPGVLPARDEGWYTLSDGDVEFRLPRTADHLAIAPAPEPEEALLRRCVRPAEISEDVRRRVEEAMEAMAPSLYSELEGSCPECGAIVEASFDPVQYTLRELRDQAAFIYEEVCSIAHHYHWSEAEILALPAARRARYAELATHFQQERTTA
jgi:hypothetical protein